MGRHDIARWGRESPFSPTTVLQWDEARRDPRHAMHQAAHNQTNPHPNPHPHPHPSPSPNPNPNSNPHLNQAAHNQTLPGLDAINTTRRTLLLPAGLLQPAATYVFAFTAYVASAAGENAGELTAYQAALTLALTPALT